VNPVFEEVARSRGFYSRELIAEIAQSGSLQKIRGIPPDVRKIFVTAFDVTPRQHLETQAAFQRHSDNSVSKTINLPREATVEDVRKIYLSAYRLKCKGITIYRYGSKEDQVLSFGSGENEKTAAQSEMMAVDAEYTGGCSKGACPF
jgi:ribonucleoside-diphosphate reductase alpha chain